MSLQGYLDGLFAEPGPGPATAAYREWQAFIDGAAGEEEAIRCVVALLVCRLPAIRSLQSRYSTDSTSHQPEPIANITAPTLPRQSARRGRHCTRCWAPIWRTRSRATLRGCRSKRRKRRMRRLMPRPLHSWAVFSGTFAPSCFADRKPPAADGVHLAS